MVGLCGHHKDSTGQSSSLDTEAGRKFDNALFAALDALEAGQVSYAVIGGIAASGLGRPRSTQDIDFFVRPEDAEAVLHVLEEHGFRTEETNPTWLFKAFKDGVLVDIIFRSEGGFYFDNEMRERCRLTNYHGRQVRVVSPEDFILIKCAVHSEEGPHHWHDALSVLSHAELDWNYLLHRSRKASRRLLALLIYAQSDDIWVPNRVIMRLFYNVFGATEGQRQAPANRPSAAQNAGVPTPEFYMSADILDAFTKSGDIGALAVDVVVENKSILLRGEIQNESQRLAMLDLAREKAPAFEIKDQLIVTDWQSPGELKDIV
jgi:predicted nucleotidyltransferase